MKTPTVVACVIGYAVGVLFAVSCFHPAYGVYIMRLFLLAFGLTWVIFTFWNWQSAKEWVVQLELGTRHRRMGVIMPKNHFRLIVGGICLLIGFIL